MTYFDPSRLSDGELFAVWRALHGAGEDAKKKAWAHPSWDKIAGTVQRYSELGDRWPDVRVAVEAGAIWKLFDAAHAEFNKRHPLPPSWIWGSSQRHFGIGFKPSAWKSGTTGSDGKLSFTYLKDWLRWKVTA